MNSAVLKDQYTDQQLYFYNKTILVAIALRIKYLGISLIKV